MKPSEYNLLIKIADNGVSTLITADNACVVRRLERKGFMRTWNGGCWVTEAGEEELDRLSDQ